MPGSRRAGHRPGLHRPRSRPAARAGHSPAGRATPTPSSPSSRSASTPARTRRSTLPRPNSPPPSFASTASKAQDEIDVDRDHLARLIGLPPASLQTDSNFPGAHFLSMRSPTRRPTAMPTPRRLTLRQRGSQAAAGPSAMLASGFWPQINFVRPVQPLRHLHQLVHDPGDFQHQRWTHRRGRSGLRRPDHAAVLR